MSNLLPNLDDLLAMLPGQDPSVRDAHAVAEAAASASTVGELDQALTSLVADWRKS
ncbi:MAG TPA: hypothetical protein VFE45_09535 [Coriobacteriia bacterium]|nr:hypothetical protein [Coriobacteriia bacterium]